MLDENLPTFYFKSNGGQQKHNATIYLCQHGNEPEPAYSLRHLDPALVESKNRYAVALYDPYVPDILYGEVLLIPEWTQPSLSQEAIRQNGGVPPPPEPILPTQFTIQLYNPDQQVIVRYKHKTWNTPASWEFEMPQKTFRQPSSSTLDRTQSDPAVSEVTPKLKFSWRKDGKLSKDLACFLAGKTTSPNGTKTKNKEPDITISIFKAPKEITLYEPNLYRVDMEDFKGLEVVLMLGAVVIRDVFFTPLKAAFNVSDPGSAAMKRKNTPPLLAIKPVANGRPTNGQPQVPRIAVPQKDSPRPPRLDPRRQWEIEAENARLRQQQEAEAQEKKKRAEEEERRTKKLLEAEEKEKRKKQAEIDKETERLKRLYGQEEEQIRRQQQQVPRPSLPPRPSNQRAAQHPHAAQGYYPVLGHAPGPYLNVPGGYGRTQSSVSFAAQPRPQSSLMSPTRTPQQQHQLKEKRSSFFRLRRRSDDNNKLAKKKSAVF
ncbi:hypothetical protein DTO164E3_7271 [Paecilomyces variotii]|nr:hypothetical protein DTO164E3_7271 [Paecilomyces variotii]KAJ9198168.1 hypothetical protein DTO032I3_5584 [Paecilomyces variotii]KAJ9275909.1 hypothetical protein DTO021D3_7219 [Paecilomyces variotii]KAJ9344618.1 hypothetical protein DTO027B6_2800 [Paecilomyces variotii]KAJ9362490.1 hypothetical protein DTO027B9_167 [Paecilomyces variotii]